ncbi:MAG: hypothetical protein IRZ33_04990 [Alicyclobacillaceae bacterium]|nr:hypothetical protein [Alicyclobacillaceae bacterium]
MPLIDRIPTRPQHKPLDWKLWADRFNEYIMNPDNRVIHTDDNGHLHFTAFLEGAGCELITYGAIVLGKLLRGDDVTSLLPSLADYFSEEAGMFVNAPGDRHGEYWYLMYVNALAMAIIRRALMDDEAWVSRLRSSADRMIAIARQVRYDFNDQGYDFAQGRPYTKRDAYRQPDTVGGYAYLMTMAHEVLGDDKYLFEARIALQRYQSFQRNPWYEIPSQSLACQAAARLNAAGDDAFDLSRIVRFALDPDDGSLHVGSWGGRDITGLMRGWRGYSREEADATAYSLETLVLLPYLLPTARYDVRFARDIGCYALHVASNSRWFFSEFLPEEAQSRPDLTVAVPYETLHRSRNGRTPYAAGDFQGQKSVYGGALILWLGEIVKSTSDDFILQLDLAKTDFLAEAAHPTYLWYNPWPEERAVPLHVGPEPVDVYDLATGELRFGGTGQLTVVIPPGSARVLVCPPAGLDTAVNDGVLYIGGVPVDYRYSVREAQAAG